MRKSIIERDIMKVLERGNEVLNNLQKECNVEKRKILWWYEWLKEQQEELIAFSVDDNVEVEMNKVELSSANTNSVFIDVEIMMVKRKKSSNSILHYFIGFFRLKPNVYLNYLIKNIIFFLNFIIFLLIFINLT